MDERSAPDYEFGGFRLDTASQVLTSREGEQVALPSRAYQTLLYLVERAGELVEKSSLMAAVWPRSVVEENNLSQCIFILRKVLGETAGERRFILTVPGRGFKFVAPVRVVPRGHERWGPGGAGPLVQLQTQAPATALKTPAAAGTTVFHRFAGRPGRWAAIAAAAALLGALGIAALLLTARPHAVTSPAEYEPLTDVADSATAPALSPDGRMLAFIRGGDDFLSPGQIWLKLLPNGEPIRLTQTPNLIFGPTFTPDGTQVAYTEVAAEGKAWDTWLVPITGGPTTLFMSNASGLTFIGAHEVMYSEFKTGLHLGLVASMDDRSRHRDIYLPSHERGMAHFSYLSPDRKSVLVVEMGKTGDWERCRLVPFDGSSAGAPVGPASACRFAAWSADGKWMYFAARIFGHSHLWRQRYPDGIPEQITFGPTDEETVGVSPDGHSLVTSMVLGHDHDRIWMHDGNGERALTTEGNAYSPWVSEDAKRLYFLAVRSSTDAPELWRLDIASGRLQSLLAGFSVTGYDISYDEQQVAFTTRQNGLPQIWLAPLDRHEPPKLVIRGGDEVAFDRSGRIFFRSIGEHVNYLNRMNADGSENVRAVEMPIVEFYAVAPDGKWVTVGLRLDGSLPVVSLVPVGGGAPHLLARGWWPSRWSRDGKLLYIEAGKDDNSPVHGRTVALRLDADGVPSEAARPIPADSIVIPHSELSLSIGSDATVYAFERGELRRNIYRIPLH
jgi:eukaryotic-like serine/threonine-protein kinase